ncbi:MAG: HD domain-containing protein [Parcubacteria group bacterium]|nr:HD domain-containing protein [Parcubacteria group bacterium]
MFTHLQKRSLAHIVRFSAYAQNFPESVAEHSFFVAYTTAVFCQLLKRKKVKINSEKAVMMALVHDMEEMFSGDILGPFKHYSPDVMGAIRKVNERLIKKVFAGLPNQLANHFVSLWNEEGEQKVIEAQVVKLADRLSLIAKCSEEVKGGNQFFKPIYKKELASLKKYNKSWWKKIKNEVLAGKVPRSR